MKVRELLLEIPVSLDKGFSLYNSKFRKEMSDSARLDKWYRLVAVVMTQMTQFNWKVRENMLYQLTR